MRNPMFAVLMLGVAPAFAAGPIVPTDDVGSDCVAATLVAKRTPRNRIHDERYCARNTDRSAYTRCLRNASARETITFFTDRCNASDEGAYVSFDGRTYQVWRDPGPAHAEVRYAGTYRSGEVVVRIVPKRLIERFFDGPEPLGVQYAVDVVIEHEGRKARIAAIYDDRR